MAQEPYSGVPEVAPDTRVPDRYQHIQANPSSFGALIGQGLEKAGRGLEQTSENLFNVVQFAGKVNVDDQVNQWIKNKDTVLYGEPGKTVVGPDGQAKPDTGYMGLQGRAAADARQSVLDDLEKRRKEGAKNLNSAQERALYEQQTRRLYADAVQHTGSHASGQWSRWAEGVNGTGADLAMSGFLRSLDNPEQMAHHARDYIDFKVKHAQLKFGDEPSARADAVNDAKRDLLKAQVQQIGANDPVRALSILDKNREIAGAAYPQLVDHLRGRKEKLTGDQAANEAILQASEERRVVPAMGQPQRGGAPTADAVHGAILGQESGANPNIGNSVDGAVGIGQIMPATFQQYAKPGEDIRNPSDNYAVSRRIIDDYYRKYNGDAARAAVAYFSGPGNVAPAGSPTPYQRNAVDGNGKSTQSYVADVAARLNGEAPNTPSSLKAGAYQLVMTNPSLNHNERQHALTSINQTAAAAQIAADATEKRRREENDQAANSYMTRILTGDVGDLAGQIASDPKLTWQTKEHLTAAAQKHLGNDVKQAAATYGPGFWEAYKNVTAPVGDPNRISDTTQLLARAGQSGPDSLTLAGVQKLNQTLLESRKSVNDQAVHTAKIGLMNYAKGKLSFEADTGPIKIRDPKGEAIFNAQFIPKFEAAFDKWVKDGKDPWPFLTQESVDKMISGMRSKSEMEMERLRASGEGGANAEAQRGPVPAAPVDVEPTGWATVMRAPPVSQGGKPWPYANWAAAVNSLRAEPTPERIAQFNKVFGPAGYDGKEILEKLEKKAAPAPAATAPAFSGPQP